MEMGQIKIDWEEVFGNSFPIREDRISSSSATHAAAIRAGRAAAKRARAGTEWVATASSGDEQPRGVQALHLRLEALCSELEGRVGQLRPGERSPLTRAAAKAAAELGQDDHPAAENAHSFNHEDEQREHAACKYRLKPSPVSFRRKKNHGQDDKEPAPPEGIFEVLREIPSLERADLLSAYSLLIRDDRLFRSLMALPEDMRKDWLLMEIASQ